MSPRHSTIHRDRIEFSLHLVFSVDGTVRMTRAEPALAAGERSMALSVVLPTSLWQTPHLRASVTVPTDSSPSTIQFDMVAAADMIKKAIGVDVVLTMHPPADDMDDVLAQRRLDDQP